MNIIGIIGSGNVGSALALSARKAGIQVLVGVRFPLSEKSLALATQIGEDCLTTPATVALQTKLIIITTPPDQIASILNDMGNFEGKIIVDATNSIRVRPEPYPTAFHAIRSLRPEAAVVKCFNTTGFENMREPHYGSHGIDVFMSGDDAEAKSKIQQLALTLGFGACHDFGGADKVELQEKLALCWINLAIMQGMGRNIALNVIHRPQ